MSRPAWKSHIRPVVLPPDELFLLTETTHHIFRGSAYARSAPLIDGRRSEDEIHAALELIGEPSFSAWLALRHLRELGFSSETNGDVKPAKISEEAAFWESLGEDAGAVADRLVRSVVFVSDAGGTGIDALRRVFEDACVRVSENADKADLIIAAADDFLDPRLDALNRTALEMGRSWMTVKLAGTVFWIGPLFVPGKTACWTCLAQRLHLNRQTERLLDARLGQSVKGPLPAVNSSIAMAAGLAAVEAMRWLATGKNENLENGLLTLDLKTNSLVRHQLVRRPQCPVCGEKPESGAKGRIRLPVDLPRSAKSFEGGRSESPEAALARLEHHVSPITGPIRSVSESYEGGYLHVSASQTFPMYRYDFRVLRVNLLGRSGGKGFDPAVARVSAICEALERYSGSWQPEDETIVTPSTRQALGGAALDPSSLFGFSTRQYSDREAWNAQNDEPHAWVPKPFEDDLTIDWVPVRSLTRPDTRLVPAAYCYYGHPDLRHMFCSSDSNGCAAGATVTEALLHGLLELIERDAAAIWWYNRVARPGVDLDSFRLPEVRKMREVYRAQRREFWAIDLTHDLGVPVVVAISASLDPPEDIIYGFGSDLDPAAAVKKAVLEMNQSLFSVFKTVSGKPRYRTDQPAARRWFQSATRANQPYLLPDPASPPRTSAGFTSRAHADCRDDVLDCVGRLRVAGLETFVLDQTRPDVGLSVCRVAVPGLCHFWRRFGHQRLYEVPVSLGWQESGTSEDQLNPWFIYF